MQYLGGKNRIKKDIAEIINNEICRREVKNSKANSRNNQQLCWGGQCFVSLFCGSCVIESLVNADIKILNDKHEYLIEMYKGLQNGYKLPDNLTQEEYYYIKEHKNNDKALTGFVGFGCSFCGKWFGGYASNRVGRNYCLEAKKHTMKLWNGIKNSYFYCLDYKDVPIPESAIIYCDPPYKDTTGYTTSKDFNYEEFWEYMRKLSKTHKVFISEEQAPADFECIWSKEVKRVLDVNKSNIQSKTEKLFVYNPNFNIKGEKSEKV